MTRVPRPGQSGDYSSAQFSVVQMSVRTLYSKMAFFFFGLFNILVLSVMQVT